MSQCLFYYAIAIFAISSMSYSCTKKLNQHQPTNEDRQETHDFYVIIVKWDFCLYKKCKIQNWVLLFKNILIDILDFKIWNLVKHIQVFTYFQATSLLPFFGYKKSVFTLCYLEDTINWNWTGSCSTNTLIKGNNYKISYL